MIWNEFVLNSGASASRQNDPPDGAAQIVVLRELRATIESLDERFSRLKSAGKREIALRVVYDDSLSEEKERLLGSEIPREEVAGSLAAGEVKPRDLRM